MLWGSDAMNAGETLRIPRNAVHQARTKDSACRSLVVYNTGTRQRVAVDEGAK